MPTTVGVANCGVSLIIENTQSLSTGQVRKCDVANTAHGPVKAMQLDSTKTEELANELKDYLTSLPTDANVSVFLYSSPESILKHTFLTMLHKLIDLGLLRLICVDETRQFVRFGSSFRPEFGDLRKKLFSKVVLKDSDFQFHTSSPVPLSGNILLKVPVLFMTATMSMDLLQQLQVLVGIKILHDMCLWG